MSDFGFWIRYTNWSPIHHPFASRLLHRQKRWGMGKITAMYKKQEKIERLIGR